MKLEERCISPKMGLPMSPFSKEMRLMSKPSTTRRKVDYFRLPRPLWRKLKKYLPKQNKSKKRRVAKAAARGLPTEPRSTVFGTTCSGVDANGRPSIRIGSGCPPASSTNVSRELDEDGHLREADETDGRILRQRARRDRLEVASDGFQELRGPFGR